MNVQIPSILNIKFLHFILIITLAPIFLSAQVVERFEHLNTSHGLSQSNVQSMFCDSKGYMWFGTWNGLNKYDGYSFKVYKVQENEENTLTHNRISQIWEDSLNILWVKTYDGYMHYFIPETEEFITLPYYQKSFEEKNSVISYFEQSSKDEIWLGSTNSGVYYLKYDPNTSRYQVKQFISRGISTISNNSVSFVATDNYNNIWIGTQQGLNQLKKEELEKPQPIFNHFFVNTKFSCALILKDEVYFGTEETGILKYNQLDKSIHYQPVEFDLFKNETITLLYKTSDNLLIIGSKRNGLIIYDPDNKQVKHLFQGKNITKVYEDRSNKLWVNTGEFGIYQINPETGLFSKYTLSLPEQTIVDEERQFIYEDSNNNLWIGLHGGLALYNRPENRFEFYKNDPLDGSSLSSNIVYCITEDKSGMLWVGTGHPNGGVEKIVTVNPAFKQVTPKQKFNDNSEYIFRGLFKDSNGYLWASTKSGKVYLISPEHQTTERFSSSVLNHVIDLGSNAYSIMEDTDGFIWLGTKGGGLYISSTSVRNNRNYKSLSFRNWRHESNDSTSLSSDNIYTILQDNEKRVWIGTYGGGINLAEKNGNSISFKRFNTTNSTLSSNDVRYIFEDSEKRLWIATAFGLNFLTNSKYEVPQFKRYLYNPEDDKSISYNDVIHIYEDSKRNVWFSTFGGGVNKLLYFNSDSIAFQNYSQKDGLVDDAVFSMLEDKSGDMWFSTEKGISRLITNQNVFENFDKNNGLTHENFSENTACKSNDLLFFGGTHGILMIAPENLIKTSFKPPVVLTNFQLFNKDVDFKQPDAPIDQTIETLDEITLQHFQSSFSFEYAALSYFAPNRNKFAFMLENFDSDWNEVGSQNKATYTNLTPGEYVFKVKAANWDGTWNDEPRTLAVTILPPWWKTNIAYFLYLVAGIGIFSLIWRSYSRYHQLQNDLKVEKRVSEIKLKFFTNISHEIRTPLTLILGPIDDIKASNDLPPEVSAKIGIMERNGKRMLRLVNQLLDFRKIQKNKMKLMVQQTNINEFVQDIVENFQPLAQHKNINLQFHPIKNPVNLWVDPKKFDSVIFNLLSNALKFTGEGKNIQVEVKDYSDQFVDVLIKDEGSGIPAEKKHLLFQRFSVLSDSSEEINSSGIGLSLSYEIVKLHKGDILVDSERGKGCCFTVRMMKGKNHFSKNKVEIVDHPEHEIIHQEVLFEGNKENENEVGVSSNSSKILIVEDNPEIVDYLKSILSNYQLLTAANGVEGLKILENYHPDLIISDVMMPEMDGVEMTRRIKENLDISHIPVIMLTAKSNIEDQILGVESGAEAYILKPFNSQYLKTVVNNIFRQREKVVQKYIDKPKYEVEASPIQITSKDEKFLEDVMKIVEDNYTDPDFNVEKLVEMSYVSRTVFYNKIKGLTGLSPIDFLRQVRLKIAGQLLIESDYNISEIAFMTGFNNVKYFRQHFKEVFGSTPNEYKSKNQEAKKIEKPLEK